MQRFTSKNVILDFCRLFPKVLAFSGLVKFTFVFSTCTGGVIQTHDLDQTWGKNATRLPIILCAFVSRF